MGCGDNIEDMAPSSSMDGISKQHKVSHFHSIVEYVKPNAY